MFTLQLIDRVFFILLKIILIRDVIHKKLFLINIKKKKGMGDLYNFLWAMFIDRGKSIIGYIDFNRPEFTKGNRLLAGSSYATIWTILRRVTYP